MTTVMTVAAGVAIGYFIIQYLSGKYRDRVNGRLHKSARDKKVCGVCGGLAEFLGVDPTIVRLAWAVLSIGWGSGILLYLVCALILPEETAEVSEK